MIKTNERNSEMAARVKRIADLTGLKTNQIYKVLRGDRENELVMSLYFELKEGETLLMQEVKKLVPFNN